MIEAVQAVEKCIYCGAPVLHSDYKLNPKARKEFYCCTEDCLRAAKAFVLWDSKVRMRFYLLELVFVAMNLIILGFQWQSRWQHFPIIGMGAVLYFFPLPFSHYTSYQRYGIKKTQGMIQGIALLMVLFGVLLVGFA